MGSPSSVRLLDCMQQLTWHHQDHSSTKVMLATTRSVTLHRVGINTSTATHTRYIAVKAWPQQHTPQRWWAMFDTDLAESTPKDRM